MEKKVEEIVSAIDSGRLSVEEMARIAYALGQSVSRDVLIDSRTISPEYKDDQVLQTFDVSDWISKRNKPVLKFLMGIQHEMKETEKNNLKILKCIENIYYFRNTQFISPLAFVQNLLPKCTYYKTGCKNAALLNCPGVPCGSYTTLQNWIKDHSREAVKCPERTDVVTFFDNNQVLQRKWRVVTNFKSHTSVITTLIHVVPDIQSILQCKENLSPKNWYRTDTEAKNMAKAEMVKEFDKQDINFRTFRNEFVQRQLKVITMQMEKNGDIVMDEVDKKSTNSFQIPTHTKSEERYKFVTAQHPEETVSVSMGEPCFENPCSYEAVIKVFDHIINVTNVKDGNESRKWTMVGCDGLPYTLGSRIIDNYSVCHDCKMELDDAAEFEEHKKYRSHCTNIPYSDCRKYMNLMMLPGLGHYEINMSKALMKLLWYVIIIDLAKMLGFKSIKALQACQGASDNHKTWQILQIFMFAMAQELLQPYCRLEVLSCRKPTVEGFYLWLSKVSNPNFKFMSDVVFTSCLALHVLRAGTRRNNSTAIQAGKFKLSPLFFGLNMPFYMETFIRDSFVRLQCPHDILAFIEKNESYSVSGNESKGEGRDFVLENFNRKTKMWIPAGLPDKPKLLQVCRNIDRLEKVHDHLHSIFNITESDDDYTFSYDISNEIFDFRCLVRQSKYLAKPFQVEEHKTLSGKNLDHDLVNFMEKCKQNRG